jgi:DNA repair protein RadC
MTSRHAVADGESSALADYARIQEDVVIRQAIRLLEKRLAKKRGAPLDSPTSARDYLRLKLAPEALEVFCVMFLDSRHRMIAFETLFRGTIDGTTIYPRAVIKRAIEHNCAAVIFAHNHPSGVADPSEADRAITRKLQSLLSALDIRVLDHMVVTAETVFSFAEAGWL